MLLPHGCVAQFDHTAFVPAQEKKLYEAFFFTLHEQLFPCQLLLCSNGYNSFAADTVFTVAPQHDIA